MSKLSNKVAVITGGNSGIGLATAKLFAQEGARVAISGRNPSTLAAAEAAIGKGAIALAADTAVLPQIDAFYERVSQQLGRIDVLVVNAGIGQGDAPLATTTEEAFDLVADINFKGAYFTVQKALPYLNDSASIILNASVLAGTAFPGGSVYAATKAAVRSLARTFSAELAPRGIRVNVISPGATKTAIWDSRSAEQMNGLAQSLPAKRLGKPEEIAEGILFLASDASAFMLGSDLLMDGGMREL